MKPEQANHNNHGQPMQRSLIRLQVEELVREQTPNYEAKSRRLEPVLKKIQQVVCSLPSKAPVYASNLEKTLKKNNLTQIPFPTTKPSTDAKHQYAFEPPAPPELVGSFSLHSGIRRGHDDGIDCIFVIPEHLLEEKDYLDYRYIHKKAFYLACIASELDQSFDLPINMSYSWQDDNELQPCIIIELREFEASNKIGLNYLRVLIGPPPAKFKREKLRPWVSCLRSQKSHSASFINNSQNPTPLYNGTIVAESSFKSYHSLLRETAEATTDFRDACRLMRIWLRQRNFGSSLNAGGFGGFEASCCVALMLKSGHNVLGSPLSKRSDSLQLFVSLLKMLAHQDLVTEPLLLGGMSNLSVPTHFKTPMLYDVQNEHNILFKMTRSSYQRLRVAAKISLEALLQPEPLSFYPVFIARLGSSLLRYDHVFSGQLTSEPSAIQNELDLLHQVLTTAFTDRVYLVDIRLRNLDKKNVWSFTSKPPSTNLWLDILIGVLINPEHVARRIDLGPTAEDNEAAEQYRQFWGEKADLRRFANGEIRESVTWPVPRADTDVLESILSYIVQRNFTTQGHEFVLTSNGTSFPQKLLPISTTSLSLRSFSEIEYAYERLQESVRAVSGQPLHLRQLSASSPGLRYATRPGISQKLDVVLQYEGSVRWPEDMEAIQQTKVALLSKMGELLKKEVGIDQTRVEIENSTKVLLNRALLEVCIKDTIFRLRIYHDREGTLLERIIKNKMLHARDREAAAAALAAHRRAFVHSPQHTQALRDIIARIPLISPTIRLFKLWIASHLISAHFPDELLELIAVHVFTSPFPYNPPGSLCTAFLRILALLSRWDWQSEPLIVNLATGAISRNDVDTIMTNFQAWRKVDPGMHHVVFFVASNIQYEGNIWTSRSPSVVAVNRLISLSKTALKQVANSDTNFDTSKSDLEQLFQQSLSEYDFVIHLNPNGSKYAITITDTQVKDVKLENVFVRAFVEELQQLFEGYVVLFHNYGLSAVIGGLWLPRALSQDFKLSRSWGTAPSTKKEVTVIALNQMGILHQIAALGGNMISRIVLKGEQQSA